MKALLVGVSSEARTVVGGSLASRAHDVTVSEDGAGALRILGALSPALVVVEDPLPDMSAAEFCRRMRTSAGGTDAVILVIAAGDHALPAILDAGATDIYFTSLGPAALEVRVVIAERLVAQHAALKRRELRFRRLFESGMTGVIITDFDGNFKEANPAFLQMLGYTGDDMAAGLLNWVAITPPDRLVPDIEDRAQLRSTGFLPLRERTYVHKDGRHLSALVGSAALEGTNEYITYVTDISARKGEEEALRASEAQYRALFDQSPFPKFVFDPETLRVLAVNDTAVDRYGHSRDAFLRMTLDDVQIAEAPEHAAKDGPPGGEPRTAGLRRHRKQNGDVIDVELTVHGFVFDGKPCALAVARDVTEQIRLEAQLRQTLKMDAIGNLAGGIAHDFNNLLSVILSYSDMLTVGLPPGDPMREDLEEIQSAGRRAADLTRQLLAFSRQQILRPQLLDANAIIDGVARMMRRLVGEDVELHFVSGRDLGAVRADPGQIEQVLINLVLNARDAMARGGRLTIETANVELDAEHAKAHGDVAPGAYVMLAVTDTGSGMDAATRERIFEPFFTTKEKGKGTGLGLSTVFGIVQQSGGGIVVDSAPREGTKVRVYLPRLGSIRVAASVAPADVRAARGTETILLVEDEAPVRTVTRTILERQGYEVLEAQNGGDALLICEQHEAPIHVLLTDVVMPRMSGWRLAERLRTLRPDMQVLYMSGYTDDAVVREGVLDATFAFLQKPITPESIATKLRKLIDSRDAPDRATLTDANSGTFEIVGHEPATKRHAHFAQRKPMP